MDAGHRSDWWLIPIFLGWCVEMFLSLNRFTGVCWAYSGGVFLVAKWWQGGDEHSHFGDTSSSLMWSILLSRLASSYYAVPAENRIVWKNCDSVMSPNKCTVYWFHFGEYVPPLSKHVRFQGSVVSCVVGKQHIWQSSTRAQPDLSISCTFCPAPLGSVRARLKQLTRRAWQKPCEQSSSETGLHVHVQK